MSATILADYRTTDLERTPRECAAITDSVVDGLHKMLTHGLTDAQVRSQCRASVERVNRKRLNETMIERYSARLDWWGLMYRRCVIDLEQFKRISEQIYGHIRRLGGVGELEY